MPLLYLHHVVAFVTDQQANELTSCSKTTFLSFTDPTPGSSLRTLLSSIESHLGGSHVENRQHILEERSSKNKRTFSTTGDGYSAIAGQRVDYFLDDHVGWVDPESHSGYNNGEPRSNGVARSKILVIVPEVHSSGLKSHGDCLGKS